MTQTHKYRRLFASDLIKIDKKTKNIEYDNDRANQLNQIEKLVQQQKPKVIKEKTKPKENIIVEEQPQQELRRSTRERKKRDILDL